MQSPAKSPAKSSGATPERSSAQDAPAEEERGKKRAAAAPAGPSSKRPRYDGKAFNELTISELEGIVREAADLKRQVASRDEEIAKLREKEERNANLSRQLKAVEAELGSKQKEAGKLQSAIKDQDKDLAEQVEHVKASLKRQLTSQFFWHNCLKDQLQKEGREIMGFVPNVSPEVLKALGAEAGTKTKYADTFWESTPVKTASNGLKLGLVRNMTFKYVKATGELKVEAVYRVVADQGAGKSAQKQPQPKKQQAKKAPKKKAQKSGAGAKSGQAGAAEEEEDDEEAEDDEEDFDEEEEDGEAEGEPEVPWAEPPAPAPPQPMWGSAALAAARELVSALLFTVSCTRSRASELVSELLFAAVLCTRSRASGLVSGLLFAVSSLKSDTPAAR